MTQTGHANDESGIFSTVSNLVKSVVSSTSSLTTDDHDIPRTWSYDRSNDQHVRALQSFVEYLNGHELTTGSVRRLWVADGYVRYSPAHHGSNFKSDCEKHYLIYPDFVTTFEPANKYADDDQDLHWGIALTNAVELDPSYYHACPFKQSVCDFCSNSGPNHRTRPGQDTHNDESVHPINFDAHSIRSKFEEYLESHNIPVDTLEITVDRQTQTLTFRPTIGTFGWFRSPAKQRLLDALAHYPIRHAYGEVTHSDYDGNGYTLSFDDVRLMPVNEHFTCRWAGVTCDYCAEGGPNHN